MSFFYGKRVFVTGHTGFKGAWLSFLLTQLGAEVCGFALEPQGSKNLFTLLGLNSDTNSIFGDVRDRDHLRRSLIEFEPEIVFHLAAQALVKESYENPGETYSTNVMGSLHLLESVLSCASVKSLVYVTSDKCYENLEWAWGYRENDVLGGIDPYSSSKACAEILFSSFSRSFFKNKKNFGAASARAGNVIGGGDWSKNRIVPDCVRAAEQNSTIVLRNPNATRPWQHVLEPLSGYIMLAEKLFLDSELFGGSWNFGPSSHETRTVSEVAHILLKSLNSGRLEIRENKDSQHEATLLKLNCDRANQLLGWTPKWNTDTAIQKTAIWYREAVDTISARRITANQINEYFGELS